MASSVYDARGNLTRTTDAIGKITSFTYDTAGNLLTTTDALGHVTSFEYDSFGNQTKETDLMGRLVSSAYPDGTTEARSYDDEGRLVGQVDRAGRTTTSACDATGNLLTTILPDGASSSNVYDDVGQLVATTDARGNTTSFEYDAGGRRTATIDPLGTGPIFGYDEGGNQTSVTDAWGNTTTYAYDALGRLTTTTQPDGNTTATAYDALGRRIAETDQAGLTTAFLYDSLGRLTGVEDALGQVTSYSYDEVGNRLTQSDANGHTTRFEYDPLGRQTARVFPDGSRETMAYNADGTLASHTAFNGATRAFEYDATGLLTSRTYPGGGDVTFTYTATGQRATVTDSRGTTTYTYDDRNRLLEKTDPAGHKLGYTYDLQGNRTSLTVAVGTEVVTTTYAYDSLDRLATVNDSQGGVTGGVTTLGYDANGNRAVLAFPNSVTTSYTYDALNRLTELGSQTSTGEVLQNFRYTLGPAGNRIRIDEHSGTSHHYAYDDLYQLTQDRVTTPTDALVYQRDYTYDPVGNRLEQLLDQGGGPTTIATAYDTRDRLLTADATSYGWDANGNLVSRAENGPISYQRDFENRLTSATLANGTLIEITYDADGNRVQTAVTPPGEPITAVDYLVDTTGFLSHVVADIVNGSVRTVYTRADGELIGLARPASGTQRYYHADGLGSVRVLSDEIGTVTDRYDYTAFGELIEHTGMDIQPYRFAGEPLDPNLGFYYNRARWMDPSVGRFVSTDTFAGINADPATLHRYAYVSNNPVLAGDPSGLFGGLSLPSQAGLLASMATLATLSAGAFALYALSRSYEVLFGVDVLVLDFTGLDDVAFDKFGGIAAKAEIISRVHERVESYYGRPGWRIRVTTNPSSVKPNAVKRTVKYINPWWLLSGITSGHTTKGCQGFSLTGSISSSRSTRSSELRAGSMLIRLWILRCVATTSAKEMCRQICSYGDWPMQGLMRQLIRWGDMAILNSRPPLCREVFRACRKGCRGTARVTIISIRFWGDS